MHSIAAPCRSLHTALVLHHWSSSSPPETLQKVEFASVVPPEGSSNKPYLAQTRCAMHPLPCAHPEGSAAVVHAHFSQLPCFTYHMCGQPLEHPSLVTTGASPHFPHTLIGPAVNLPAMYMRKRQQRKWGNIHKLAASCTVQSQSSDTWADTQI